MVPYQERCKVHEITESNKLPRISEVSYIRNSSRIETVTDPWKYNDNADILNANSSRLCCGTTASLLSSFQPSRSSSPAAFNGNKSAMAASDFLLDISNYIPAGCLCLERHLASITAETWSSCKEWQAISHPRDYFDVERGPMLPNTLQELLLASSTLKLYRALHQAGWIRLEFKMRNRNWGQIRVYILPDDVGRARISREDQSLRRSLQRLLLELNTDAAVWNDSWSPEHHKLHTDGSLGETPVEDEMSLFHIFNTLPSPKPDMSTVRDDSARAAMDDILNGSIDGLLTKMHPYQRRSAAMMLQREAQPGQIIDPRLRRPIDMAGKPWFCDIINGTVLREPRVYEASRGGICAETMGLGKTLICLALILVTRDLSSQIPVEYSVGTIPVRKRVGSLLDMCASNIGRTGTPWKRHFSECEEDGSEFTRCTGALRRDIGHYHIPGPVAKRVRRRAIESPPRKVYLSTTTLVVVPSNLVRQWEREIEKHTTGLKVLIMKDSKKALPTALDLREYDIVLFSRQRFEQESKDGTDTSGDRPPLKEVGKSTNIYHSPLRDIHFKRLITDEGHTMGNSTSSSKSNAVVVVDFLELTSRWIVSGTPTGGLYGNDISQSINENVTTCVGERLGSGSSSSPDQSVVDPDFLLDMKATQTSQAQILVSNRINANQERKDLEKLGNIAKVYLKSRPWSGSTRTRDNASWNSYVMQPRHGIKSHGNMACLRNTLEGMMIRHRQEDVEQDIGLPPLYQKSVYLEGSVQDKLSINIFSLMITSNAVTSERKDADYLFHPSQRKALGSLVANLRQASFFWSGFTKNDVQFTIKIAEAFLEKGTIHTSDNDRLLLHKVVEIGTAALSNSIWLAASEMHEMPMMLENNAPSVVREAWALDRQSQNPTLIGAAQLHALQKTAVKYRRNAESEDEAPQEAWLWNMDKLVDAGNAQMESTRSAIMPAPPQSNSKMAKIQRKLDDNTATLAGGLKVGGEPSPRMKQGSSIAKSVSDEEIKGLQIPSPVSSKGRKDDKQQNSSTSSATKMKGSSLEHANSTSPVAAALRSATIISTASSKLSYLVSQVLKYQLDEKIIIFYEADNVAFYIAQALEAVSVEHLIYAKSLSSDRRSLYLEIFNNSTRFRVLLMDIGQAAFGLDISTASRVYFVNPILSRQVEAQAVKRAHRMGQLRPVYVETLILKDTIEEMIVERRKDMTAQEQNKCKTVLDDQTMYDWIKNVRFVPIPQAVAPVDQMAMLENPQLAFIPNGGRVEDHDDGLIFEKTPSNAKGKAKGKRKRELLDDTFDQYMERSLSGPIGHDDEQARSMPARKRSRLVILGYSGSGSAETVGQAPTLEIGSSTGNVADCITVITPQDRPGARPHSRKRTTFLIESDNDNAETVSTIPSFEEALSNESPSRSPTPSKAQRARFDRAETLMDRVRKPVRGQPGPPKESLTRGSDTN